MHAPIELVGLVGRHAFDAGTAYARQHRAVVRRHDEAAHVVVGTIEGSGRNVYTATTYYDLTRNGVIDEFDGRCSCPVQVDCKHTVALLVTALTQKQNGKTTPSLGRWRSQLEGIFPDPAATPYSPLALTLQFAAPAELPGAAGWRAAAGGLEARAMRRGKKGKWIATGASWSEIQRNAIADADPAQLDALAALVRLHQVADPYSYGIPAWLSLAGVNSRELWSALADVVASGVNLMEQDGGEVALATEPARATVAVGAPEAAGHPDLTVTAALEHPTAIAEPLLIGRPAHGYAGRDEAGTLTLVPLATPATRAWMDLRRAGTVVVPGGEREVFERTILPRIASQSWRPEGSYEPAPPPTPTFVMTVRLLYTEIGATPRASVECRWSYGEGPHAVVHTLPPDPRGMGRDAAAERAILARVSEAMAPLPTILNSAGGPLEEAVVAGHAFIALMEEVVPRLEVLEHVRLDLPQDVPTFRDLGEAEIAVDVVETTRDWFDLEVRLKLADRDVPIGQVITALARNERTLFMEDGGYVKLDRPELDHLRQLLEEGRALQDQRRAGLRVSRLNLSWWEELQALGVIDHQAQEWLARVKAATTDGDPPPLPTGLQATMRPYQREGYEWLTRLRHAGLGGVLADDMGLGKTLQTLAMILEHKTSEPDGAPYLVVAPTSVVSNWAAEAARFTPDLTVAVISATAKKRNRPIAELAAGADIVVTSYTLFRLEHEEYAALEPAGLILDEAQNVKNRTSRAFALAKTIDAGVKFAITGTPIENNLTELWAMFAIAAPGLLGTPQQFHELYAAPIERGHGEELELLPRLRRRIAPFLLRRTKEQVTPDLPPKQEQVLSVELEPAHRRVYQRHLGRERQRVLGLVKDMERNRVEVLSALTRLRQLAIDASLVDEEYADIPSSKLEALLEILTEAAEEGHRVLVFSQFTRYLAMIAARLDAAGMDYAYLDGSTTRRARVIEGFAQGTQPAFLISLKAGGVGLNLAMADYCILADPWWNPAAEAQAVDRAHRIGQTRPVMVYRMVAKDTIEEKVMALQESKRALVAGVLGAGGESGSAGANGGGDVSGTGAVSGKGAAPGRLTAEDIRDLLA